MTDFEAKVLCTVRMYGMLKSGDRVTVALSGGADSTALLLTLISLSKELGITVSAAHYNHCLRGAESDGDEAFAKALCDRFAVPFTSERGDVKDYAEKTHESIELAARKLRYDFLRRASNGGKIATAHNADDNAETVLYNLARGTGIKGLCGIPPVRDEVVRPLVSVTRQEIEAYLTEKGQTFVTDSTNLDDAYTRNKIRHNVLPPLASVNENAVGNILRLSNSLRADYGYLKAEAEKAYIICKTERGLSAERLSGLHKAISSRVIIMLYEEQVGVTPESRHVESILEMLEKGERRVGVQCGFTAENYSGELYFVRRSENEGFEISINCFPFSEKGVIIEKYSYSEIKSTGKINNLLLKNTVDCDKISGMMTLRSRKDGDKVKLQGRGVTKSLKKLFNESKISNDRRNGIPIISDEKGVLWVSGFGVDERVSPSDSTENILVISVING